MNPELGRYERQCWVCGAVTGPRASIREWNGATGTTVAHWSCLDDPDPTRGTRDNEAESECRRWLVDRRLLPSANGYPDLWWLDQGILCLAEAKANRFESWSPAQAAFMRAARSAGCRTFRFDLNQGLVETMADPADAPRLTPLMGRSGPRSSGDGSRTAPTVISTE